MASPLCLRHLPPQGGEWDVSESLPAQGGEWDMSLQLRLDGELGGLNPD